MVCSKGAVDELAGASSLLRCVAVALAVLITTAVSSKTVDVKYRGVVDLKPLACTDTQRSSVIQRVCYG
jgi:hypothetical protein